MVDAATHDDLSRAAEQLELRAREAEKAKRAFEDADHKLQCAKYEMARLIEIVSPRARVKG